MVTTGMLAAAVVLLGIGARLLLTPDSPFHRDHTEHWGDDHGDQHERDLWETMRYAS
jgi:hypothetical protein